MEGFRGRKEMKECNYIRILKIEENEIKKEK